MGKAIVGWILEWVANKIADLVRGIEAAKRRHAERVEQADKDAKKAEELKPDSSAADVDDAIDSELDHL